ncbi:MAG: hypothetical protein WB791_04980 [Waddliaceae bacterium]
MTSVEHSTRIVESSYRDIVISAIHDSSVADVEEAQVVVMLDNHRSLHHLRFHSIALHLFYNYHRGDRVLLEDDSSLPPEKLYKGQVSLVDTNQMLLSGWDLPIFRLKSRRFTEEQKNIPKAIESFRALQADKSRYTDEAKQAISNAYEQLVYFVENWWEVNPRILSRQELAGVLKGDASSYQSIEEKKQELITQTEIAIERGQIKLVVKFSRSRQLYLVKKIHDTVNEGKVFVIMGHAHACWKGSRLISEADVERLLRYLKKKRYVILDPGKIGRITAEVFNDFRQQHIEKPQEGRWKIPTMTAISHYLFRQFEERPFTQRESSRGATIERGSISASVDGIIRMLSQVISSGRGRGDSSDLQ